MKCCHPICLQVLVFMTHEAKQITICLFSDTVNLNLFLFTTVSAISNETNAELCYTGLKNGCLNSSKTKVEKS